MRRTLGPFAILVVTTLAPVFACGSSASPEKTGTETFGCYVGSCVSPGVSGDDEGADSGRDDAGAIDAGDAD